MTMSDITHRNTHFQRHDSISNQCPVHPGKLLHPGQPPSRKPLRFTGVFLVTALLLAASGLVFLGCGGGGGGSLPGAVTETGTLSGKVELPGGADPAGALVSATRMTTDGTQPASAVRPKAGRMLNVLQGEGGSYVTVADSEGYYTFEEVEKGGYHVVATKGAYKASQVIDVQPRVATVVDFTLTPTGTIYGRVILSGADSTGGDMSGTMVLIKGTSYLAVTDYTGYYTIAQVPIGTDYQLMFVRPGYETTEYTSSVSVSASNVTSLDTVAMVVDSGQKGTLAGVAQRPAGAAHHEGILIAVLGTQYMAVTDVYGNWNIQEIPAGTYTLTFADLTADFEDLQVNLEGIEVIAGEVETLDTVVLQPTGIAGTVSLQGGAAANGAMVQVQGLGQDGFDITGTDGSYEILGIDPGTYTVAAILTGYQPKITENVQVQQGAVADLDFTLLSTGTEAGTGTVAGTVYVSGPVDDDGGNLTPNQVDDPVPLGRAYVVLSGTNHFAVTNDQGVYSMIGVSEGSYDMLVDVEHPGLEYRSIVGEVQVVANTTSTRDITVPDTDAPEIDGPEGIVDLQEVAGDGGAPAIRVFFNPGEDVSAPVVYTVYYNDDLNWDQLNWENNLTVQVPEAQVNQSGDENVVYVDIDGLTTGKTYVFGVTAADSWGNERYNGITLHQQVAGTDDVYPPVWTDGSRSGLQTAYATATDGQVAVEFEDATDDYGDGRPSTPPIYFRVYYAPVTDWDGQDWRNNEAQEFAENLLETGSFYTNKVILNGLTPGIPYTFGVRIRDSAQRAEVPHYNEDGNESIRLATPAGSVAGDPAALAFGLVPQTVTAGETWATFGVAVTDDKGVVVPEATHTVTLSLLSGSNNQGLEGTLEKNAGVHEIGGQTIQGTALFDDVSYAADLFDLPETIVIGATAQDLAGATIEVRVEAPELTGDAVINEVVLAPKNDWNETTGGNQAAFDDHPGYGTADNSDGYIELKNTSGQTMNVSGWYIGVFDIPDAAPDSNTPPVFTALDSAPVFLSQGTLQAWPHGTRLVVGGVQGISSTVLSGCFLAVFDGNPATGSPDRVAEVSFGDFDDGNTADNAPALSSTGKGDEAVCLDSDGVFSGTASVAYVKRFATPGAVNAPTDTKPPLYMGSPGITTAVPADVPGGIDLTITSAYDTASEPVSYNVYYSLSSGWNSADWSGNTVIHGITTETDNGLHAELKDLTPGETYTIGVRAQDSAAQPNEDGNTVTSAATATPWPDSDGDGINDNEDDSPNDAAVSTPDSATGTGKVGLDVSGTTGAQLAAVESIDPDSQDVPQTGRPADYAFPDGLVSFNVQGVGQGATVQVTTTWPSPIPHGAVYYKVDDSGFHAFDGAEFDGSTVTLTLTDGGAGDADGTVNGVIDDPGGVALPEVTADVSSVAAEIASVYGEIVSGYGQEGIIRHRYVRPGVTAGDQFSYILAFSPVINTGEGFQELSFSFPPAHTGWGTVAVEHMHIDDGAGNVTQVDSSAYTADSVTPGSITLEFAAPFNFTRSGHLFSLKLTADSPSASKPEGSCRLFLGDVQAAAGDIRSDMPDDSLSLEVPNGSCAAEITPSLTAAGATGQQFTLFIAPLVKPAEQIDTIKFSFHPAQTGWGAVSLDSFTVTTYDDGENIVTLQEGTDYTLGTASDGTLSVQLIGGPPSDFNLSLLALGISADAPSQGFVSESCAVWFDGTAPPSFGAVEGDITGGQGTASLDMEVADAVTLPAIAVSDDGQYTANSTGLHATWQVTNGVTVQEYRYAIGTTSGGSDVVDWTSTGTTASVTADGLNLQDGQEYFIAIKGQNQSGLWGQSAVSDGITVWATAPAIIVSDDGEYTSAFDKLNAAWSVTNNIPVVEYQYAVGTTAGGVDTVGWTSTGTAASVSLQSLTLQDARIYYVSVKGSNPADVWNSPAVSDGITYAAIPHLLDVAADDPDDGDNFLSAGDTLTVTFDRDTSAATGPITRDDVNGLIDIGSKFLGQDYAGNWTSKSVLVITIIDATRGTLVPGDSLDIRPEAGLTNTDGTSDVISGNTTIAGDWGTGPGIPHHLEWHTPPPSSVSRDVTWDNFIAGVYDEGGALVSNATGTVNLSVVQGNSTLRGGSTSVAVTNGVAVFSGLSYPTVETIVIAAASQDLLGVTAEVNVVPPSLTGDAVINEVVFEPENDWNESTGGNQALFDNHPGYGTVDSGDTYIELRNTSGQTLDVSGWVIGFQDLHGSTPAYTAMSSAQVFMDQGTVHAWPNGTHLAAGLIQGVTSTAASGCRVTVFAGDPAVITPDRVDEVEFGEFDDGSMSDNAPDLVSYSKTSEAVCLDTDGMRTGDASADYVKRFATPGAVNVASDTLPPLWKGTPGAQELLEGATPGSLKVMLSEAYDTAHEPVAYNVYFAPSGSWNNSNWAANTVISGATVLTDPSPHVILDDLTPGAGYTVGVRAQDTASQPNEDTNTITQTGHAANYPDTDGDGILDNEDDSPQNAAVATPESATGTGKVTVDVSGSTGAQLAEVKSVDPDSQDVNQAGRPTDYSFPDGLVSFNVQGISQGATVQVVTTWPSDVPDGAVYYKVGDTGFTAFGGASFDGNTVTLTLTDGGAGDADGTADGIITDPGGVAYPVVTDGITSVASELAAAYSDEFIQHRFLPAGAPSSGLFSYHLAFTPVMSAGQGFQELTFSFPSSHTGWGTVTVESMEIDDGAGGVTQVDAGSYTADTSTAGTVTLQFDTPFNATRSGHVFSLKLKADAPSAGKPLAACRLLLGTVQASVGDVRSDMPHDSLSMEVINGSGVAEITPSLAAAGTAGQQFTLYLAPLVKAAEQVDNIVFTFHPNQTGWGAVSVESFTVTTYDDGENTVTYQDGTDYTLGTSPDGKLTVQISGGIPGDFNVSLLTLDISADTPSQGFASESCSVWFDGTTPPSLGAVEGDISGGQGTASLNVEVADASTLAAITVNDDGEYSSSATSLGASWQVTNGVTVQEYQYAIGTTSGATDVRDWTSTGSTPSVTANGLTLQDGQEYFFAVKGQNQVGLWSQPAVSDGITVWATGPAITVTDDGDNTSTAGALNASWSVTNNVPVTQYQYAIGTTSGGTDIVNWTSTGTTASVARTGLTLQDAQAYYVSVKGRNPANVWGDPVVSDGITYAAIPQLASVVFDDPDESDNYLSAGDTLTITFDRDTIANAGPITKTDVDNLIDIGTKSLGADYAGSWTSKSVLVITLASATRGTLAPGDNLGIKAVAGITNAAGTSTACADSAAITGDLGTGPGIPHHLAWVTAPPVSVVRETAWADFTVGVYDITEVLVNNATGTAALTVTQGNDTLAGGSTSVNLANGAATFSGITYGTAETIIIRADSGSLIGVTAEVHIDNVASQAVADGSWHDTNTWDGAIPGANDEAVHISERTVTHSDTGVTSNLGRLSLLAGDLTLSGGTITTTGNSTVDGDSQFTLSGGTIGGTGSLSVQGNLVWATGTIGGTGGTTAAGSYSFGNTGTRTLDGTLILASEGSLLQRSIEGSGSLENTGIFDLEGSCTIAPAVTNDSGATMSIQGNSNYGAAWITMSGAVSNAGTMVFDDVNTSSNSEAHLTASSGVTNTGTLQSRITGGPGGTTPHVITAAVTNTGTMDIDHDLTIVNPDKNVDSSAGAIDVTDGEHLNIAPGYSQSGQFTVDSSTTLSGSGTIRFYDTVNFNASGDITLAAATPALALNEGNVVFGGGNTITIGDGKEVAFTYNDDTAADTTLVNQGTLRFRNSSNDINGSLINDTGGTLAVEGAAGIGDGYAYIPGGFTNDGTVVFDNTDTGYAREGFLYINDGALTNTGTIRSSNSGGFGSTNEHWLKGTVTNTGTIDVDHSICFENPGKTIDTTSGAVDIAAGATLRIAPGYSQSGILSLGAGTSFTGAGILKFADTVTVSLAGDVTLTSTTPALDTSGGHVIFDGGNSLTIAHGKEVVFNYDDDLAAGTSLVNQGGLRFWNSNNDINGTFSNASGAVMVVEGYTGIGDGYATFADGFTNAGTIVLDNSDPSYAREAFITITSGALVNTGTIQAANSGEYGSTADHRITGAITNTGTIDVDHNLALVNPAKTINSSGGTIDVAAGAILKIAPGYSQTGTLLVGSDTSLTGTGTVWFYNTVNFNTASDFTLSGTVPSFEMKDATVVIGGGNTFTIGSGTELILSYNDDLAADTTLVNQGSFKARNSLNEINGAFSNAVAGTLTVEGASSIGAGSLTFASGFTNDGTIVLDNAHGTASYTGSLTVTSGTLVNAGTLKSEISGGYAATGEHSVNAAMTNTGTIDVDHNLLLRQSLDTSTGSLDVAGGKTMRLDPVAASATITVGADTTLSGSGTITFTDTVYLSGTADFTFTDAMPTFDLYNNHFILDGGNTFTIAAGREFIFNYDDDVTSGTSLVNQGTLRFFSTHHGIDGPFSNVSGAALYVEGTSYGSTTVTFASGFTNAGTIVMDNSYATANKTARLDITGGGTLANTGTLQTSNTGGYGSTGEYALYAAVTNTGTLDIGHNLRAFYDIDTSGGVIDIASGTTLIVDPQTSPSTLTLGGTSTLTGAGMLAFADTVNFNASVDFTFDGTVPVLDLYNAHIVFGGGNTFTIASGRELAFNYNDDLADDTALVNQGILRFWSTHHGINGPFSNVSGASLYVEGTSYGSAHVTFASGFTNAGTIVMDNSYATANKTARLDITGGGTLANTGTMQVSNTGGYGSTGEYSLYAAVTNTGTMDIDHNLRAYYDIDTSDGVIDITDGVTLVVDPQTSPSTLTLGGTSTLTGAGTVAFADTVNFNASVDFTFDDTVPVLDLYNVHVIFGGGATFTIASGRELAFNYDDDLAADTALVNQGILRFFSTHHGIDGSFSNTSGASLYVEGTSFGSAAVTFASGFTNAGTIVMDNSYATANKTARLDITGGGTLANTGTLQTSNTGGYGSTGEFPLYASVTNTGAIDIDHNLRVYYDIDSSAGTIDIADGRTLTMDPQTSPSTLTVSGTSGFIGTGTLAFADTVYFNSAGDLTLSATTPVVDMSNAHVILGGGSTITVASGGSLIFNYDDDIASDTTLVNQGTVTIRNTHNGFSGLYTNSVGSTLLLDGDPTTSAITFNGGAANAGTITMWGDYYSTYIYMGTDQVLTNTGTINFGGTTAGNNQINGSVTNQGLIDLTVDSLEIVNTATTSFDTSAGSVTVPASRELVVKHGTTVFGSDTVLTGDGIIYLDDTQTLSLASDFTYVETMPDIYLRGTVTVSGAGTLTNDSDLRLRTNNDVFSVAVTNNADSTLTLDADPGTCSPTFNGGLTNNGTITMWGDYYSNTIILGTDQTLVNTGTINLDGTTGGNNSINGAVTNTGTIHVTVDDMQINNAGAGLVTSAGTLSVDSGRILTIADGTTTFGGSTGISGAGTINLINTHTLEIGTGYTHNTSTLDLHFEGAVTVSGTGIFTNNGTLNLETTNDAFNTAVVNNATKTLVIDAGANTSTQYFNNSLTNNGTLTFNGTYYTATLNMGTDQTLTNTGTINMTGNDGGGNAINGEVINTGTIDATVDDMVITNAGNGLVTSAGTLNVADGRVLEIAGGTTTFGDGTGLTGDGRVNLSGTHTLNLASNYSHDTSTTDLYFGGAVTVSGAGTFTNNGAIALQTTDDAFNVAVINNAAKSLIIEAGNNHSSHTFNAGLTNNGTITLNSTFYNPRIYLGAGQTLTNTGTITQTGTNGGEKSIDGAITNTGTIAATVDHMHINNADGGLVTSNGTLSVAENMSMVITGGTTTFGDGTTLSGDGQVNIYGTHTLSLASDYTHTTTTVDLYLGGDVTVNGAGSFINDGAIKLRTTDDEFDVAVVNNAAKTLTIDAGPNHSSQYFNSSLTNNGTLTLYSDNYNSRFYMAAEQTLTNTGTITLGGTTGGENTIQGAVTNTGTIEATVDHLGITNADGGLITSSGTLSAAAGMQLGITGGTTTFGDGTVLSGDGQVDLKGTHTLTLASDYTHDTTTVDLHFSGVVTVNGAGTFINNGTINLETANDAFGVAVVNNAARNLIIDAGANHSTQTFNGDVTNNGILTLNSTNYNAAMSVASGQALTNTGTITVSGTTGGENSITAAITNTGTIETTVDHLGITNVDGGLVTSAGTLSAAAGMTLGITNGTTTFGSSTVLSGEGRINLYGTQTLNLASNYSHDTTTTDLHFEGVVTVSGSGTFTNNGALNLETQDDAFSVPVVNNATRTLTIDASAYHSTQTFNDSLTNNGTLTLYSSNYSTVLNMAAGQTLTNTGTINLGGTTGGDNSITGAITNTGTINADVDHLAITNADGGMDTSSGTLAAASGKTLSISGGTTTFGSGTVLSGEGRINLAGTTHTLTLASNYSHDTTTADLQFDAAVTVNGTGTFTNNGTLNLDTQDDAFDVAVVNNAGKTLYIDAVAYHSTQTFNSSLTNNGTLSLYSANYIANLTMDTGQTLTNNDTIITSGTTGGSNVINGDVLNGATIELPYNLAVNGTVTSGTTSLLKVYAAGTSSYTYLSVTTLDLSGTGDILNIEFDAGYTPVDGHTFTIVQNATGGITGGFESLTHNLGSGWILGETVNADSIVVTLTFFMGDL